MIKKVKIENFKSIKHTELNCGRVNVFIGEPNSGKSNILEAIVGIPSAIGFKYDLRKVVRFEDLSNLFYDEIADKDIKIIIDDNIRLDLGLDSRGRELLIKLITKDKKEEEMHIHGLRYKSDKGDYSYYYLESELIKKFKFYKFILKNIFHEKSTEFLLPPNGDNLVSILAHNKELRKIANNIVSKFGFKLAVKPREGKLEIHRELEEGVIVSFPYTVLSDTLQRIIFYSAAVCTNKDSVIAMEEPEAHAFPHYTKYLAELIAQDKNNQYFITTHNPYFLLSLLEKTPKDEIAVFVTYYKDYRTKVKRLSDKKMQEVVNLDVDVFFNLDMFLED